jgi:phosphate transport system substrate-binding protein
MLATKLARLTFFGAALVAGACGSGADEVATEPIRIDGSSTLYPLTTTVAEEFGKERPGAKLEVRFSGTGAGFDRFCRGETDIQDASRPIEPNESTCR